jgi:hypothetical protein
MTVLRIDREHINFNEGGRFFTFYWRWTPRGIVPKMLRVWAGLDSRRSLEFMAGFGQIKFGKRPQ